MFTGMVEYSAMMQAVEQVVRRKANRYPQLLEHQVNEHGGEIIQGLSSF